MLFKSIGNYGNSDPKDPHFASVILLSGFDGTDGDTSATDESLSARSITCAGACSLSNDEPVFGDTSLSVNLGDEGTGRADVGSPSDFVFGTGDFTIEGFARCSIIPALGWHSIFGGFTNSFTSSFSVFVTTPGSGNTLTLAVKGQTALMGSLVWGTGEHHFAVSRNGGTIRLFVDGDLDSKSTAYAAVNIGTVLANVRIGGDNSGSNNRWTGYLDELRVTDGVGRYNSDTSFTVPAKPYPRS